MANSYSVWNNFFLSAGIPSSFANDYASTFSQHRIRIDMLKDITKDILIDMGIKAMGDIIAILKHAKQICTQDELDGRQKTNTAITNLTKMKSHQVPVSQISQKTPITTGRVGPSISSLVGVKIHTPISTNTGSLGTPINTNSSTINKRPSSTISNSLAKRLKPANESITSRLSERTLTVKYPPNSAVKRAQQRLQINAGSSVRNNNSTTGSIKSRLGATSVSRPNDGNKNIRLRNSNGRNAKGPVGNSRSSSGAKSDTSDLRELGSRNHPSRLKSTVFNRLGEGPR